MKKRSCKMTTEEKTEHEFAVKIRKMTDKQIYEFICDEFYVPMKFKELAVLLQVPKNQRDELKSVMDSLEAEGKVHVTLKGKYVKTRRSIPGPCQRIWFCIYRRRGGRYLYFRG